MKMLEDFAFIASHNRQKPRFKYERFSSAFSLVEVTLAIGIVSFAFLAVLSLMPAGLTRLRQAKDATANAQIMQQINDSIRMADYSTLSNSFGTSGGSRYFIYDSECDLLTNSTNAATVLTKDARYIAKATVIPTSLSNTATGGGTLTQQKLAKATIRIRNAAGFSSPSTLFSSTNIPEAVFFLYIARAQEKN